MNILNWTITTQLLLLISVQCWLTPAIRASEPKEVTIAGQVASLRQQERRVMQAARKVLPAVVAVEAAMRNEGRPQNHFEPYGSGVLISADGLILSQYHVTHALGRPGQSRQPGERVKVILHDGRQREATLLGADPILDLSLLHLVEPGPYPHTPLDPKAGVKTGDGVLKLGHPAGYRRNRAPVVRLGRVLSADTNSFAVDCLISGGDSGGPLYDLDGRLAGIVRNSAIPTSLRDAGDRAGLQAKGVMFFSCSANKLILTRLEAMRQGKIATTPTGADMAGMMQMMESFYKAASLAPEHWTQGERTTAPYRASVKQTCLSVVSIQDGKRAVALGTVVGTDGWIITKASQLPPQPKCKLPDGRVLAAQVVGVDTAFDLALLRVAATGLHAIVWANKRDLAAGTFLAAVGAQERPLAVGVVSVPLRNLEGPFPAHLEVPRRSEATLPTLNGSAVQGRGYWVEFVEGEAAAAGIRPGDVLLTIAGRAVRRHQDLADSIQGRQAGERVPVSVLRTGSPMKLSLRLDAEGPPNAFSSRSDDFPVVFEHDAPVLANECGGPVVNLAGQAIGITIARVGPHGCMAIPAEAIWRLLPGLKAGKQVASWRTFRTALSTPNVPRGSASTLPRAEPQMPVTITLAELKQHLQERAARFHSLFVEYDVITEAHIEPSLLMSWNLHSIRDYQEHHRIAYAGRKQFTQVQRPGVMLYYTPEDRIKPDPRAPQSIKDSIEQQRTTAQRRKQQGYTSHLFARRSAEELRSIFDGNQHFTWVDFRKLMMPAQPEQFYAPTMYLAGLGLRPVDPQPGAEMRAAQQQFWFPDNFAHYSECRVEPTEELVDGMPCIVVTAKRAITVDGKPQTYSDKFWFDPKLGYAPRQWEQRVDGTIVNTRIHKNFEEFAPGCWLPWESIWSRGTPTWVAPEYRNQHAYSYRMTLRKARVGDVDDNLFKP